MWLMMMFVPRQHRVTAADLTVLIIASCQWNNNNGRQVELGVKKKTQPKKPGLDSFHIGQNTAGVNKCLIEERGGATARAVISVCVSVDAPFGSHLANKELTAFLNC